MQTDAAANRPIWFDSQQERVQIIDQRKLPHEFVVVTLNSVAEVIEAISAMYVRGAPLIGVTAAYGVYLAARRAKDAADPDGYFAEACQRIKTARPTAVNLHWAVDRVWAAVRDQESTARRVAIALDKANQIAAEEIENCRRIGMNGLPLIEALRDQKNGGTVNILTHCNAGWLACVAYGTATAPMYAAFDQGIDIHIWVDETRPLNQGARLTAWELGKYGVPHTVITDNAGGHLMQHGMVDMVIVGTDRTTFTGDVANKIGTYLKALAAKDNGIPFYVALPSSTFDWQMTDGLQEIPIEERDPDEVRYIQGPDDNQTRMVLVPPQTSRAANYAFDVTPARLVSGFITERGICDANAQAITALFPEKVGPIA